MKKNTGITLIEVVVYVALLGALAIFIANTLIQISDVYSRARVEREVIANARLILGTLAKTVGESQEIYGPTSLFLADMGQLSVKTLVNPPIEHQTGYVDFYVDNSVLWVKQEGQAASPLSASTVRITKFRLERIMQGLNRESVKVTLEVASLTSKYPTFIALDSTIALRGNY